jgi:hypothetical protein
MGKAASGSASTWGILPFRFKAEAGKGNKKSGKQL